MVVGAGDGVRVGWWGRLWVGLWVGVLLVTGGSGKGAVGPTEYQLKAAFLFNVVKFTTWAPASFEGPGSPIVVGVGGGDPFGGALQEVLRGMTVGGRPLEVRRLERREDGVGCHVVFLARSEAEGMATWLKAIEGRPVLTVGDMDGFCEGGGMVNLTVSKDGRIRPELNPEAARAVGVQLSARLLNLPMVRLIRTEDR